MRIKKYSIVLLMAVLSFISVPLALGYEFDDGGSGGGTVRYFLENGQYYSHVYARNNADMDEFFFSETSCMDGLKDVYGHFDYLDKIYLNLQASVNPDSPDLTFDKWWYEYSYSYFIDSIKVTVKIQNPQGDFLSEDLVAGLTQYKCTGGGTQNAMMVVLYSASTEFIPGMFEYPLSAALKTITNNVPNPMLNKYEDGPDPQDSCAHWWKFDYGFCSGDPQLGLQIIFSPTFGAYKGVYHITYYYEIIIKKAGWYKTLFDMVPQPAEERVWTYTNVNGLTVIKDIGIDP